jgi:hypothetical protein
MRLTGGSTAVAFLSGRVPIRLAPRASPGRGLPRHECLASLTADAVRLVALALLAPRFARTLPVRQRVRQSVLALAWRAQNATSLTPLAAQAPARGARGWF